MVEFLTALAAGLVVASLYVTYGLGLAVVYRTTGVLNFAHGAIGTVGAYLMFGLLDHSMPYVPAALISIAAAALVAVLVQTLIVRYLPTHSAEVVGIATLGILIVTEGILLAKYGGEAMALPSPLPAVTVFHVGDYVVQTTTLLDIGIATVASAAVAFSLYRTRLGLAVRAVSEGSNTAAMMGINPNVVRGAVWGASGALSATAGLLIIPSNYLTPDFLTTYLIATFVAVVLGGFERLLGVIVGGVAFGVVQSMFSVYVTGRLSATISFLIILAVLTFFPYGVLGRPLPRVAEARLARTGNAVTRKLVSITRGRSTPDIPQGRMQLLARAARHPAMLGVPAVVGVVAILTAPLLDTSWLAVGATVAATYIGVLGVDLIFGYSGQLSIGQSGFMLVGGYATVLLQSDWGVPFLLALVVAALAGGLGGIVFGLPAARLRGVYLAVLTLALALAVPELAVFFSGLTGGDTGIPADLPSWLTGDTSRAQNIYFFTVVLAALAATLVLLLVRASPGRSWRAVRDSDTAAAASGIDAARARTAAFAAGSALCALSGGVLASVTGYLSPGSFSLWTSIYLIVAVVVGGRTSTLGALLGAVFTVVVPYESSSIPYLTNLLLGILLIVVLMVRPDGLRGLLVDVFQRVSAIGQRPPRSGLGVRATDTASITTPTLSRGAAGLSPHE
jgi:branched-chain amino acid transport system permease protein